MASSSSTIIISTLVMVLFFAHAESFSSWAPLHPTFFPKRQPSFPFQRSPFSAFDDFPSRMFRPFLEQKPLFSSPFQRFPSRSPLFPRVQTELPHEKQSKSETHILTQQSPQYKVHQKEDGLMVEVSLPGSLKDSLSLQLDKGVLKLKALVVPSPDEEPQKQQEENQGGLFVSDVEEDEETKEIPSPEMKRDNQAKVEVNKEYVLSLRVPKNTNKELLSAHFEDENLFIHLPSLTAVTSRAIPIQ